MKRIILFAVFACAVVAQLAVPASMIIGRERVLQHGIIFKLKTRPVDPADLFRGRYVALSFEETTAPITPGETYETGDTAYVELENAPDGFAHAKRITKNRPNAGDYVKVRVASSYGLEGHARFDFPFDRYYMEESKAPGAEAAYFEHNRAKSHDAYVTVRVRNGEAVVENLYIGDQPINDYLSS